MRYQKPSSNSSEGSHIELSGGRALDALGIHGWRQLPAFTRSGELGINALPRTTGSPLTTCRRRRRRRQVLTLVSCQVALLTRIAVLAPIIPGFVAQVQTMDPAAAIRAWTSAANLRHAIFAAGGFAAALGFVHFVLPLPPEAPAAEFQRPAGGSGGGSGSGTGSSSSSGSTDQLVLAQVVFRWGREVGCRC